MTLAAYAPLWHAGFIWDDDAYVTANRTLRSLDGLRQIWLEPGAVPQYYPLTFTSFWIEYHLWGLQPFGYHLVNVVLHALNALLVWRVLRWLRVPGAWMAAAIFALHPMHVESVAWVTERKNVLSGVLVLSALLVYLRGVAPRPAWERPRTTPATAAYLAVCVLFLGALLSKTVTCTLPAVLLLLMWWQHGALDRGGLWSRAPLFVLGISMASMTVWVERHYVGAEGRDWSLSLVERCLVAGRALWFYPRTLLWPRALSFVYPRWSIDAHVWWQYLFPAAAVAVLVGLLAKRAWHGKGLVVGVFCYAGMMVPALGFFNVYPMRYSFVADHFAYLPSVALIALATAAGVQLIQRTGRASRLIGYVIGAGVLLLLAGLTARQCSIYHDLHTLWTDTLAKNPECWMAHNNLAMVLVGEGQREAGITHYREALRWKPDFSEAHSNLGVALADQGKTEDAIAEFHEALRWKPDDPQAHSNLGNVLQAQGRTDEAVTQYRAALEASPGYADAHFNLAATLAAQGKTQEAMLHYEEALRANPDSAEAHNNFGNLLRGRGQLDAAIAQYTEALRVRPAYAEADNNLGVALAMQGKHAEALLHLEQALRNKPDYADAHSNAGNVLQAQGRFAEAVAHYEEALRLQPTNADAHNNLGMALLAQGQTKEAIVHFGEALRLKPDSVEARNNLNSALRAQE